MSLIDKVCDARYISVYDDKFVVYAAREGKMIVVIDHTYAFILVKKLHPSITYCNALMTRHGFWIDNFIYLTFMILNYSLQSEFSGAFVFVSSPRESQTAFRLLWHTGTRRLVENPCRLLYEVQIPNLTAQACQASTAHPCLILLRTAHLLQ
jgi:hypothetical protein